MLDNPTVEEARDAFRYMHALNVEGCEAVDISNTVLFLASDEARCITGTTHVIDAGSTIPFKIPHPA
jgi:(+)-trans-carveol dehydrogenase